MSNTTTSVGQLGESVAVNFLKEKGYEIIERNFQRSCGELDIIARKEELVFVEVKSVRCRIPAELPQEGRNNFRPEENVSFHKRQRLRRIIQVYLDTHADPGEWRCDLLCVFLDTERKAARVKWLENIII
ncbi:MAG: YraN family protein [Candidatus Paceibacterota bacterium]